MWSKQDDMTMLLEMPIITPVLLREGAQFVAAAQL
jgi:hypothetical protein